jgi:hypothetical protein
VYTEQDSGVTSSRPLARFRRAWELGRASTVQTKQTAISQAVDEELGWRIYGALTSSTAAVHKETERHLVQERIFARYWIETAFPLSDAAQAMAGE